MKMNNRFIYGILSIVLAAVIAFIAISAVTSRTSSTCEIVRMKTAVTRGTPITTEDLELVEVGGFNLPDSVARKIEDVAALTLPPTCTPVTISCRKRSAISLCPPTSPSTRSRTAWSPYPLPPRH